jgi:hypothetical protein
MAERDPNRNKPPVSRWGRFSKIASLWVLLFLIPVVLIRMMDTSEPGEKLDYSQFSRELERGNVERVVIVEGRRMEGELRAPIAGEQGEVSRFSTDLPVHHSEVWWGGSRRRASRSPLATRTATGGASSSASSPGS